jgi:hypothetical protein
MKKLEQLALDEIRKNAQSINMQLYTAGAKLTAIRDTLRHCDPKMSKEAVNELIKEAIEALSNVEVSTASSKLIESWAEGLSEK